MGRISPFFAATPWFAPGALASGVVAGGIVWFARRRSAPAVLTWAFLTTVGSYAFLVASPTRAVLEGYPGGRTNVGMGIVLPPVSDLTDVTDVTLNVAAGLVLGLLGTWLTRVRLIAWPCVVAVTLPIAAELAQAAVPALGRSGFLLTDVAVAEAGVAMGATSAALLWRTRRRTTRRQPTVDRASTPRVP